MLMIGLFGGWLLAVVFLRPLAAGCRGLVRGGLVGLAAGLSVVSHVGVLAPVSEWWRCSLIGLLTESGLVVVDERSVGIVFVAQGAFAPRVCAAP
jgi:hypothetical protein